MNKKKVLIIDDNKDLADIFCEYLHILGYESFTANSGTEGLSKAKEQKPKVILCDIGMAGMNGYEVAKHIRQDDELKSSYLIAISGYSSNKDVERSLQAGFDKHLSKPLNMEEIKKSIDDII